MTPPEQVDDCDSFRVHVSRACKRVQDESGESSDAMRYARGQELFLSSNCVHFAARAHVV